jgi:sugar lactone lactonase YvrE
MRYCLFVSLFLLFIATQVFAQRSDTLSELRIGDWEQHLPWQRGLYITQNSDKVWFATDFAIVELDKIDRTPRFITKVEGLSDVGMRLIKYNPTTKNILVAYSNSNMDIYDPASGTVVNLPFIKKNTSIGGDKSINDVWMDGRFAYISAGFGVLKLDMQTAEAEYTLFTGVPVTGFQKYKDYYWAGTEEGVFRLSVSNPNPADFSQWESLGASQGFPAALNVMCTAVWDDCLWFGAYEHLYRYRASDGTFTEVSSQQNRGIRYLSAEGPGLLIGWRNPNNGAVEYIEENQAGRYEIHYTCEAGLPHHAIEDGKSKYWIVDESDKFRWFDYFANDCQRFNFNSPYRQTAIELSVVRDKVYVATPGAKSNLEPLGSFQTGVYVLEKGIWKRFGRSSHPDLSENECDLDLWRIIGHPQQEKFYIGSFDGGLVEVPDDFSSFECFNQYNSILKNAGAAGQQRTAISGMAFDEEQNMWICNYSSTAPIAVKKADGTLKNFSASPANNLLQVAVDQNGYKWFVVGFNGGVMVYDSGQDLDSPSDDRYRIINSSNSNLPTNTVNCVSVDLDGDVWVGTLQGVVTFECGSNVFDAACKGRRRIVNVDGFNAYLLETEDVRTIAVDGANRKWFGTTNGIFVQSSDGLTQLARFTNTNSPLFDNIITDIAINTRNGEVWIGTDKGLISLRTDAVEGGKVNGSAPYAYPNPVQPNYDGPIAIYGLARDANVKITDIAGHLVYEGKALGGQAIWDGRDYLGKRAASGVYLVYATSVTSFDNPDAIITKVVILN